MTRPAQPDPRGRQAADAAAVAAAYQQASAQLRVAVDRYVVGLWRSLGAYRDPQLSQWLMQIVPAVSGAMQQMQSLTSAYLTTLDEVHDAASTVPVSVPQADTASVRGVDAETVYARPFETVWRSLDEQRRDAAPDPPADGWIDHAVDTGLAHAREIVAADVQLAKTHTSQAVIAASPQIVGWRRQLEGEQSCPLCTAATGPVYRKRDLMPLHVNCDCSVQPVYADGGRPVAADRTSDGVAVEQHNELGPVLVLADQSFADLHH